MQLLDYCLEPSQHFRLLDTGWTWFRSSLVDVAKFSRSFDQRHPHSGELSCEAVEALLRV